MRSIGWEGVKLKRNKNINSPHIDWSIKTIEYPGDANASDLTPNFGRPHIVLLGAGASKAAFPNGDKKGRQLPLMPDFIETVGMEALAEKTGIPWQQRNFEDFYNDLFKDPHKTPVR